MYASIALDIYSDSVCLKCNSFKYFFCKIIGIRYLWNTNVYSKCDLHLIIIPTHSWPFSGVERESHTLKLNKVKRLEWDQI